MTPERMAELVARWARFYTRDLPAAPAERRREELEADLHDHIEHERATGIGDRRIALAIASRLVRGLAADLAWRSNLEETMKPNNRLVRTALRVGLGVALILSLPALGMLFSDEVVWSVADFVLAGALLAVIGIALEFALSRRGNLPAALGIAVLGIAAGLLGRADDAPGLVLLGMLLIGSACALAVRRASARRSTPDAA